MRNTQGTIRGPLSWLPSLLACLCVLGMAVLVLLVIPTLSSSLGAGFGDRTSVKVERWALLQGYAWGGLLALALAYAGLRRTHIGGLASTMRRSLLLAALCALPSFAFVLVHNEQALALINAGTTLASLLLWLDLTRRFARELWHRPVD